MYLYNYFQVKDLVLDLSGLSYIDTSGCKLLTQLYQAYNSAGVNMIIAGLTGKFSHVQVKKKINTFASQRLHFEENYMSHFV